MTVFRFIPPASGPPVVLAGDAVGPAGANVVEGFQGRPVSPAVPAPGDVYVWNGALWVPGAAGGVPQIEEISGLSNARYYTFGSDPTAALTGFTVACFARCAIDAGAAAPRYVMGTRNAASGGGGGGWGLRWAAFGSAATPVLLECEWIDNAGGEQLVQSPVAPQSLEKIVLWIATFDLNLGGANSQVELFLNGGWQGSAFVLGVAGALTAGGNLTVGTSAAGAVAGLDAGWLHGAAYVDRVLTYAEIVAVTEASLAALELQDIPGGGGSWSAAWRVAGGDPGSPWAPFVGAGALTRVGTAPTYAVRDNPAVF